MKYELVIFDLDGTVLYTLQDLANSVNYAVDSMGYPKHSLEAVRCFVGNGVANLIWRALPKDVPESEYKETLRRFKQHYRENINVTTKPYPGITEMLGKLREKGIRVGINSNKFDAALRSLCEIHFPALCDYVMGECETTPKKPDPTAAKRMMEMAGVAPEKTIYIGDSDVDLRTARNAGTDEAWVGWGFRKKAELGELQPARCFDTVEELCAFLLED